MQFTVRLRQIQFVAVAVAVAAAAGVVTAQVKQGKSRPLKTSQLMKGVVKPNCDAIKKGVVEGAPATDKEWSSLATHAALLNEASYILMDDGRCPDGVWADAATKTLRGGTAALLRAIEGKDASGAKAAFGNLTQSCKACHDKHKEKH